MKDILLAGNIFIATNTLLEKFEENDKIILCGNAPTLKYKSKKVIPYSYREDESEFGGIFRAYNLDTVVYFSRVLDGQKRLYDEIEMLENTLYYSQNSGVKKLIYVTTNDYVGGLNTSRTRLLHACEDICRQFAKDSNMDIILLRVPYLYSVEESESFLTRMLRKVIAEKTVELPGIQKQVTDFLSDEDLGELLVRIMDEPPKGYSEANVSGGNTMEMEDLVELIKKNCEVESVRYCDFPEAIPKSLDDGNMRESYGWSAGKKMEEWVSDIVAALQKNIKLETKKKDISVKREKIQNIALVVVEMIFLFLVSEILTAWTADNYRMDYVDFRLLFVVIMGTIHGTGAGIIASVLACAGYFSSDLMSNNLQIVFYNIENWLPFAAYFLCGTMVGHVRDKNRESLRFLREQHTILENKYVFLNELYGKTLQNKEDYSRQIVGYQDSFGKIYQVVRSLNSTVPDQIFYEAVNAMEEILEVSSVAIYSLTEDNPYARLNICSGEINNILSKTVNLEECPKLWTALQEKQNWYNAEGLSDYPMYAAPICRNGKLIGMIALMKVSASQMKMDYYNRFNIMCGLVQDALVRAIEYNEKEESERMIPGTRILKPEYFEKVLEMKEQLGKEGMYQYILMKIRSGEMSEKQISDAVCKGIRNTDVLGKRTDGERYVLLNQATERNISVVLKRLEPQGITLQRV